MTLQELRSTGRCFTQNFQFNTSILAGLSSSVNFVNQIFATGSSTRFLCLDYVSASVKVSKNDGVFFPYISSHWQCDFWLRNTILGQQTVISGLNKIFNGVYLSMNDGCSTQDALFNYLWEFVSPVDNFLQSDANFSIDPVIAVDLIVKLDVSFQGFYL